MEREAADVLSECAMVRSHIWSLKVCWQDYGTLFRTTPERIDLLNDSGKHFFHVVQTVFSDWVILGICRLLDPLENKHQSNLVLRHLVEGFRKLGNKPLADNLGVRVKELDKLCGSMKTYRHKRLAHLDLHAAMGNDVLGPVKFKEVDDALDRLQDFMNEIELANGQPPYSKYVDDGSAAAGLLVYRLEHEREIRLRERAERLRRIEALSKGGPFSREALSE